MEIWRPIEGLESSYEVSNLGNVKTKERVVRNSTHGKADGYRLLKEKILSPKTKRNGYLEVSLTISTRNRKSFYVHRLVAIAFIGGIPEGYNVNHKNGIKSDNSLNNLEVVTHSQNMKHAYDNGLNKPPVNYKFKDNEVKDIKRLKKVDGLYNKQIADMYGCNIGTIQGITSGRTYKHVK